jgi:hypothetical protein
MGETAGSFTLTFVPRKLSNIRNAGGWQDVLECMDFVEIWAWIPPRKPDRPLMRGFIDTVGEEFSIASGKPQRRVVITGRDYGKIIWFTKLYDIVSDEAVTIELLKKWHQGFMNLFAWTKTAPDDIPPPERPPMVSGQKDAGMSFTPSEIEQVMFESFYKPQEKLVLGTFNNALPAMAFSSQVGNDKEEEKTRCYSPAFMGRGAIPFTDLWSLMTAYQHKPWRELYVTEEPDAPHLIYRNAPWLDLFGQYVQPISPNKLWQLHDTEIVQYTLMRSENPITNFFFTYPEMFGGLAILVKELPRQLEGYFDPKLASNPYLQQGNTVPFGITTPVVPVPAPTDIPLASYQRFGFRLGEFSTPYMNWERKTKGDTIPTMIADSRVQCLAWNKRIVEAMIFNHLLEFGSLTVKGDERIQMGDYVSLEDRGRALGAIPGNITGGPRYYVEEVIQHFKVADKQDGFFVTTLQVSRGRGHLVRELQLLG